VRERQRDREKDPQGRRAVDGGGIVDILQDLLEEVLQHQNRERARRVGQP
jgi:hypothetical protein